MQLKSRDKFAVWGDTALREYLNGCSRASMYSTLDAKSQSFLFEAVVSQDSLVLQDEEAHQKTYGFEFETLDNDEMLHKYIEAGVSIFLHGPSGVGKSGRVKALDPTATRITLRPQMNPEEVDGVLNRETGEYTPPLWYIQLCEKCKKEPNRKHILFIDELTNVKPTVQSLVYSIVLDRAGKDGLWPLPDNAVVVAAGNESANNLAAYPLTNALFRRFSHIYYQVDKQSWLDWATGIKKASQVEHKEQQDEARIHPAIIAYIMSRGGEVLNQDLDEENPSIVTDPRKWEIASHVLYATKNPYALVPAIGDDPTADFASFVASIQISVDDVISGKAQPAYYSQYSISQKYATVLGLASATENQLPKVRQFISEAFGKEMLATYDSLWIGNDVERAQIISEIKYDAENLPV